MSDADRQLSQARSNLDWKTHLSLSMDPKTAEEMYLQACQGEHAQALEGANYCTMCGEHWCSIRVNKEIRASVQDDPAAQTS